MLVLCYGIPKSGSTLAFEMVSEVLRNAGYEQPYVHNDRTEIEDATNARGRPRRNFLKEITKEPVTELIEAIGPSRKIAAKSHGRFTSDLFPWLEELQQKRDLQVIASYRDPRDICLSALDAGERSRAKSVPTAFAGIDSLETAAKNVKKRIDDFRQWAALQGTLRLYYETVAFRPDEAISAIETVLGVKSDHEQVKQYVFEEARTLKNKAQSQRHLEELDETQREELTEYFAKFIRKACEQDNQNWYDKFRRKILAGDEA